MMSDTKLYSAWEAMVIHFLRKQKDNPGITKAQIRELSKNPDVVSECITNAIQETEYYRQEGVSLTEKGLLNPAKQQGISSKKEINNLKRKTISIKKRLESLPEKNPDSRIYTELSKLENEIQNITAKYKQPEITDLLHKINCLHRENEEIQKDLDSFLLYSFRQTTPGINILNSLIEKYKDIPAITGEQLRIIYKTNSILLFPMTANKFFNTEFARQHQVHEGEDLSKTDPNKATILHILSVENLKRELAANKKEYPERIRQCNSFLNSAYKVINF